MFGRGGGESYEGHFVLAQVAAVWPKSEFRGRDHTHILVRTTVIEEPAFRLANESLDENDMGDLPNFLPLALRGEQRLLGTRQHFGWIALIEQRPAVPQM
jgi:hypothetical protein